ncbi:hypothetical protein GUITHDRAFT_116148 [Guillardia theta CCMP2712]|uniref:Uncharacterized protein n=1 Tax=Guillardia theta (strain CCMP2712) TaxID=905079 RepID=L1IN12_GUITC|nr:hypothetical protein GUITHDRAFT_116148 [Guillardia theta CCMP2712]EKX37671.1 hypothetical protein GUITHDRAFT_116148 [Guillardia theta CCMP2712]|eukprot:XP_005824651.1 hypothetical protein GUITHDRAFT_116148 [Guillardia theta CCMP2712]
MQLLLRRVWAAGTSLHAGLSGLHPRVHSFITAADASSRNRSFITAAHASSRNHSFTTAADTLFHDRASAYLKHACELLKIKAPTGNAYAVALALNDKDAEKELQLQKKDAEKQLQLQTKDAEKELQLQKKDAEKQLQLQLQLLEKDHQIIVNYYKRRVAYITQRCRVCLPPWKAMDIIANSKDEEINSVQKDLPRKDLGLMMKRELSMTKEEIRFFSDVAHVFKKEVDFFDDVSAEEGELMETKSILEKYRRKSEDDSEPKP